MVISKRSRLLVAAIGLVLVAAIAGVVWLRETPKIAAVTNRLVASGTKPTVMVDANQNDEREFVAVALSEQAVDLVAPSPGIVLEMSVELGAQVPANTVVARIRAEDVTRDLIEAEAVAKQSTAEVSRARAEARDAEQKLAARKVGVVADVERKSAQAQLRVAMANLELAKRKADQSEARAAKARYHNEQLTIRAPFGGFVSGKYQNPGSTVAYGTRLLRFIGTRQPIVRFAVPHQRAASFKIGDHAAFRPESSSGAAATDTSAVSVVRIAPEADPHSGLVVVEAAFAEGEDSIRPGTVGRIELAALAVPAPTPTPGEVAPPDTP